VGVLWKILGYFAGAGLFVFGSGLAIVPFLYGGVVQQFHWRTERQFIDAGAIAGAAVILGRRALMDVPTILIALVTLALLLAPKKIPEAVLVISAALIAVVPRRA